MGGVLRLATQRERRIIVHFIFANCPEAVSINSQLQKILQLIGSLVSHPKEVVCGRLSYAIRALSHLISPHFIVNLTMIVKHL